MAAEEHKYSFRGREYTLDELRKIPPGELRRLMSLPQTADDLAHSASKRISAATGPSVSAPVTPRPGGQPLRVRAEPATVGPSVVPPPAKPPAPSVPAPGPKLGPRVEKAPDRLPGLLKEPKKQPGVPTTRLSAIQKKALDRPVQSPRDQKLVEGMRESAAKGVVYHAEDARALPGTRGAQLANILVREAAKDGDLARIMDIRPDAGAEELGNGGVIIRMMRRFEEKYGDSRDRAQDRAVRLASAKVTIGDWPQGFVQLPRTLDPGKMTPGEHLGSAVTPQVTVVGFNESGRTITPRAENRVMYLLRLADIGHHAFSGLVEGIAEGDRGDALAREVVDGIRKGKIAYDSAESIIANNEWIQERPDVALMLKRAGIGITFMFPDLTLVGGRVRSAVKLASKGIRAHGAVSETESIISNLDKAADAFDAGTAGPHLRAAEAGEKKLRDKSEAFRNAVTMEEARLAEKVIDAGDPHGIADEALARAQPGSVGTNLWTMNPSYRRHITERDSIKLQEYGITFDLAGSYEELHRYKQILEADIARGHSISRSLPWYGSSVDELRGQLGVVNRGLEAVRVNHQLRNTAYQRVLQRMKEVVRDKAPEADTMFVPRAAVQAKRAIDVIAEEAADIGVRMDADAVQSAIQASGSASVPDVERIKALRAKVDELNTDIVDARGAGVPQQDIRRMEQDLLNITAELRRKPTRTVTAQELAVKQDALDQLAKPRTGLASPSLVEKGDMPLDETPIEELERMTTRLSEFGYVGGVPALLKTMAFGMDADADLRNLSKPIMRQIKAGIRYVDQGASDFNRIIRENDYDKQLDYLSGARRPDGTNLRFANGTNIPTSGYDHIASMQNRIARRVNRIENSDVLLDAARRNHAEGSTMWQMDMPQVEFDKLQAALQDFWKEDDLLLELWQSVVSRSVTKGDRVINPQEQELMEALLFYSGLSERGVSTFNGTSREAANGLLEKVRRLHGKHGKRAKDKSDITAQTISVFGNFDETMNAWTRTQVAIEPGLQRAFGDLLSGKAFTDPARREQVLTLAERHGLGPAFREIMSVSGTEHYIPAAAARRVEELMSRVLSRGRADRTAKARAFDAVREGVQITKSVMIRGGGFFGGVFRPKYAHMTAIDRFSQLGIEAGWSAGLVTYLRQMPLELTTVPGVENVLRTGLSKEALAGQRAAKVRELLQTGGDRAASALNRLFGASGARIEVNKIMSGSDEVIMIGDKAYTGKQLRRIAIEEGAESAFDNTQLRSVIQNERRLQGLGPLNPSMVGEVAEAISIRERYGAAVTVMERGLEPREAFQLVTKAYYDYATSLAKRESTGHAYGFIVQMLDPYLAYTKNATRQIFNAAFTPEAAYRMTVLRRFLDEGSEIATNELYNLQVDEYGVDVDALPDNVRDDYYKLKVGLDTHYKGKVPEDIQRAVRIIALGGTKMYEDGLVYKLRAGRMEGDEAVEVPIRRFVESARLSKGFRQATPDRPDRTALRQWTQGQPTIGWTPDMERKQIRDYYNSQPPGQRSHLALVLPKDTIHTGMEQMVFVALAGAAGASALTGGISGRDAARFVGEYWDAERSPLVGEALTAMLGNRPQEQRISGFVANLIESELAGVLVGEVDIRKAEYGSGPSAAKVYKLPPGPHWWAAYNLSGLRSVDEVFKKYEGTPLMGSMQMQGELMRVLGAMRGVSFTEEQRVRSATMDLPVETMERRVTIPQ